MTVLTVLDLDEVNVTSKNAEGIKGWALSEIWGQRMPYIIAEEDVASASKSSAQICHKHSAFTSKAVCTLF
jgi:hypothetical protein